MDQIPRVFRFFGSDEDFLVYARGRWQGDGVHALPFIVPGRIVRLYMRLEGGQLGLELKSVQGNIKKPIQRIQAAYRSIKASRSLHTESHLLDNQSEHKLNLYFPIEEVRIQSDVDFASLELPDGWRLDFQALESHRVHVHLYASSGVPGAAGPLHFSGVLQTR